MKRTIKVNLFKHLKRPTNGKFESATLSWQENTRQFLSKSKLSVRIVIIDQAKRHIYDRHLNAKLDADAGFEITDLAKFRVIDHELRILLHVTAKVKLLNLWRKARRTSKPVASAKLVDKVGFGHHTAAKVQKTAKAIFEDGCR